jgi:hypothetical protein
VSIANNRAVILSGAKDLPLAAAGGNAKNGRLKGITHKHRRPNDEE